MFKRSIYLIFSKIASKWNYIIAPFCAIDYKGEKVHAAEKFFRKTPLFLGKQHYKFEKDAPGITNASEETFIVELQKARVFSSEGFIIDQANNLVRLSSSKFKVLNFHRSPQFKQPRFLKEKSLCMAAPGSAANYFHWLTDALPKYHICVERGYTIPDFKQFIVSNNKNGFQTDSLNKLCIPSEKIISLTEFPYLKCEQLIAPSDTCLSGNVSPWIIKWLRVLFSDWMKADKTQPPKIFVGRGNVEKRKLLNEIEVKEFLAEYGFVYVNPGILSLKEQILMFYNAEQIIAAHGAALTNVIFSRENSKLIELFPVTYINQCYWTIASHNNLQYGYLLGEGVDDTDSLHHLRDKDFLIDIEKLNVMVGKMNF